MTVISSLSVTETAGVARVTTGEDGVMFTTSATNDRITAIDVRDPSAMFVIDALSGVGDANGASGLDYEDGFLYVAMADEDQLRIFDTGCGPSAPGSGSGWSL